MTVCTSKEELSLQEVFGKLEGSPVLNYLRAF